jgi:hypothetical protein
MNHVRRADLRLLRSEGSEVTEQQCELEVLIEGFGETIGPSNLNLPIHS